MSDFIKVKNKWYYLPSLTKEDKVKLGIIDKEIIKEIKETPLEIKNEPCKKKKKQNKEVSE